MMDGEELHAQHRKRFWNTLAIAGIGGVPIGLAVGIGSGHSEGDIDAFWSWAPDWLVLALLAIAIGTILYGSWRFMRAIDEVELQDNLWTSWVAYGVYALLFPTWWVLGKSGITREPDDWSIYFVVLGIGLAYYLLRKWRAR